MTGDGPFDPIEEVVDPRVDGRLVPGTIVGVVPRVAE